MFPSKIAGLELRARGSQLRQLLTFELYHSRLMGSAQHKFVRFSDNCREQGVITSYLSLRLLVLKGSVWRVPGFDPDS